MGLIAYVLSFTRNEKDTRVKVTPAASYNITPLHYDSPGEDSMPLKGDSAALVNIEEQRTGTFISVGYIDPKNDKTAKAGEKRMYSRDPENGLLIAEIFVKNNGDIRASNANGFYELQPNGDINLNGVIIDKDGNITGPEGSTINAPKIEADDSLIIFGGELNGHQHVSNNPGSPSGPFPVI